MSWDKSIYSNPQNFGLVYLFEIQWGEPEYSFDITAVWKSSDDVFYIASDSGCRCPSPFENFGGIEDLGPALTLQEAYSTMAEQFVEYMTSDWRSTADKQYVYDQFCALTKLLVGVK